MAADFDQFFRVFNEGAAVPVRCYQAAIELDSVLRGWFQPEAGYELQDDNTPSASGGRCCVMVGRLARPWPWPSYTTRGGGLQWQAESFSWDLP
jgi:hypothetical protein